MRRIILFGTILLLILSLGASSFTFASGSQTWYLTDDTDTESGWADNIMDQVEPTIEGNSVVIASGSSNVWRANQASQGMTFPAGDWSVRLIVLNSCYFEPPLDCWNPGETSPLPDIDLEMGYVGSGGFTSVASVPMSSLTVIGCKVGVSSPDTIAVPGFTVASGDYLAFRMVNGSTSCVAVRNGMHLMGLCYGAVSSPSTDPGYPVPELAAGVLLALGLVGLVAYVAVRRKRGMETK